jgi:hypothetical protein
MTLPASHQLASAGRINILDAQPTTEFPHTPVSVVNHCVVPRREELLSDPFHSVCDATQIARPSSAPLMMMMMMTQFSSVYQRAGLTAQGY